MAKHQERRQKMHWLLVSGRRKGKITALDVHYKNGWQHNSTRDTAQMNNNIALPTICPSQFSKQRIGMTTSKSKHDIFVLREVNINSCLDTIDCTEYQRAERLGISSARKRQIA